MKTKSLLLIAVLGFSFIACERKEPTPPPSPKADAYIGDEDSDDNGSNRNFVAVTPIDQSENDIDLTITENIRRAVIEDKNLSTNAKNSKIITIDRNVTLRGFVDNEQEKKIIEKLAKNTSNVKNVDNYLEVKK